MIMADLICFSGASQHLCVPGVTLLDFKTKIHHVVDVTVCQRNEFTECKGRMRNKG